MADVIFLFESLKRKTQKVQRNMPHLKLSKTHDFGTNKLKKKFVIHMEI
jgi:hypothetical protein